MKFGHFRRNFGQVGCEVQRRRRVVRITPLKNGGDHAFLGRFSAVALPAHCPLPLSWIPGIDGGQKRKNGEKASKNGRDVAGQKEDSWHQAEKQRENGDKSLTNGRETAVQRECGRRPILDG